MNVITVDFQRVVGKVKPMHAVNNGPVYKFASDQRITNMDDYKAAGIPYARNHDASFFSTYGGEHTVDVHAIFPNFDADPYDEASYDFACTDEYVKVTAFSGAETFYRLGSKIEHGVKKYGTIPPKDFRKWAVICEHIIKHYNYGWANGFAYDLRYWEIWNEPDLDPDDAKHKRTWGGTAKEYYELYVIAATHLKACFPNLKIGGPALAFYKEEWLDGFFTALTEGGKRTPLDFFSWHIYANDVRSVKRDAHRMQAKLKQYGYEDAESILNEWNYVQGWESDDFLYTIRTVGKMKGAAFTAAVMCMSQNEPIDMLMYYDARPSGLNGLWAPYTYDRLKGYYPFYAFNQLYVLKNAVATETEGEDVYACAATDEDGQAVMIAYFNNDDGMPDKQVALKLQGVKEGATAQIYLLDGQNDLALVRECKASELTTLTVANQSMILIKLR